ncbi:MAG: alpha/beta hydrolase family protein [Allomuricauda sp.]
MKTTFLSIFILIFLLFPELGQAQKPLVSNKNFTLEFQYTGELSVIKSTIESYEPYRPYLKYVLTGFDAYRLVHKSKLNGKNIRLSGSILIPKGYDQKNQNVLVFCHGTQFDQNVASQWDSPIHIEALPAMNDRITFLPDYLGYGISSDKVPVYMNKHWTVQHLQEFITHGLKAMKKMKVPVSKKVDVVGFSQGGYAALALAEYEASGNVLKFDLEHVVSIGGPTDINQNLGHILKQQEFPSSAYLTYLFGSYDHYFWRKGLSQVFSSPYDQLVADFKERKVSLSKLKQSTPTLIPELIDSTFLKDFVNNKNHWMRSTFLDNSITPFNWYGSILVIHGTSDEDVPIAIAQDFFDQLKAINVNGEVQFYPLDGLDHITSGLLGITLALDSLGQPLGWGQK